MESKISIILATLNERDNIKNLLDEILAKIPSPVEIIVVDDNSRDGTPELIEGLGRPEIKLIRRKRRGLASAYHRGIIDSTGSIICWLDADMCMPVDTLKLMIEELKNCDLAIGSRYCAGGSDNRHWIRVFASRMINGLARIVLGGPVRDFDSGFVALRREVFDSITIIPFGYGEYFIEMVYDAYRCGLRIVEVGYAFYDRTEGVSKSFPNLMSFMKTGAHYVFRIISLRFRFLRGGD